MDLHPTLSYNVHHLSWDTDTRGDFAWKMPIRATFLPFSIFKASVQWQDEQLGFLPPAKMDKQFEGRDLILAGIQYTVTLQCDGKMWQQRFAHEFMGKKKLATRLTQGGTIIENSAILFEPFDAVDVFEGVVGAAKHLLVMQFVG